MTRSTTIWRARLPVRRDGPAAGLAWGGRAGAVALLASTLLPWYSVHRLRVLGPARVNAWQAFQHTDLVIGAAALVALLAGCFVARRAAWVLETLAGLAALAVCAVSIVRLPAIPPRAIVPHVAAYYVKAAGVLAGPFVAAVAALVVVACGALSFRTRSRPGFARRPSAAWALGAIVVAAALARFSTLGLQSYWYDEAATVKVVAQPDLHTAIHLYLGTEATPPLYYLLAWLWVHLFGAGEVALRSLSALFGTAAVGVMFLAGRRLVGARAALAAAALLAVSPIMVWYSQEARAYSLLVLMSALSLWRFALAREQPTARNLAWWAATACLALLSHLYAVFPVAIEAALLLAAPARRRALALPFLAVAGCGAALLPLIARQGGGSRTAFIATIPLGDRLEAIGKELASANTLVIDANTNLPGGQAGHVAVVALAIVAIWTAVAAVRRRRSWRSGGLLMLGFGIAALLIPLALSQLGRDYILDRNLLPAWLALALAAGAAIVLLPRVAMAAVLAVLLVGGTLTNLKVAQQPTLQRADWRDAVRSIGPAKGGRVIIVIPNFDRDTVSVYRPEAHLLGAGAIRAGELDVVGQFDPYAASAIPPGYRLIARGQLPQVSFVRLQAVTPRVFTAASLAASGTNPLAVLVEYTEAGRRWVTTFSGELTSWGDALGPGPAGRAARRRLLAGAPGAPGVTGVLARGAADVPDSGRLGRLAAAATRAGGAWATAALRTGSGTADPALLVLARRFDRLRSAVYAAAHVAAPPATAVGASRALTSAGR